MNFFVSSKLLPYIWSTFSILWSTESKSLNEPVVKNLDIKLVLAASIFSATSFNAFKYESKSLLVMSIFQASPKGQLNVLL